MLALNKVKSLQFAPFLTHWIYRRTISAGRLSPDPVQKVCLGVSDLQRSIHYWTKLLGMTMMDKNEEKKTALLGFADSQVRQIFELFFRIKKLTQVTLLGFKLCGDDD